MSARLNDPAALRSSRRLHPRRTPEPHLAERPNPELRVEEVQSGVQPIGHPKRDVRGLIPGLRVAQVRRGRRAVPPQADARRQDIAAMRDRQTTAPRDRPPPPSNPIAAPARNTSRPPGPRRWRIRGESPAGVRSRRRVQPPSSQGFKPTEPRAESRALLPHCFQPNSFRHQRAVKPLSIAPDELLETFARCRILVVVDVLRRKELAPNRPQGSNRAAVQNGTKRVNVGEQQSFKLMHLDVRKHRSVVRMPGTVLARPEWVWRRHFCRRGGQPANP